MKTKTEMPEGLTVLINGLDWEYNTDITVAENFDKLYYEINNSIIAKRRGLQTSLMTLLWDTPIIMAKLLKANAHISDIDVLCEIHFRLNTRNMFCLMPNTINLVAGSPVASSLSNSQAPSIQPQFNHQPMDNRSMDQRPANWSVDGGEHSGTSFADIFGNSDVGDWCNSPLSEITKDPLIKLFNTYGAITISMLVEKGVVDSLKEACIMMEKYENNGIIEQTTFGEKGIPAAWELSRSAV
jgi:hypothetical protein